MPFHLTQGDWHPLLSVWPWVTPVQQNTCTNPGVKPSTPNVPLVSTRCILRWSLWQKAITSLKDSIIGLTHTICKLRNPNSFALYLLWTSWSLFLSSVSYICSFLICFNSVEINAWTLFSFLRPLPILLLAYICKTFSTCPILANVWLSKQSNSWLTSFD